MNIRTATRLDENAIYQVHWSAFSEDEREIVSKLAVDLLLEKTSPKTVSLVAEIEDNIVGHIAFSPVTIEKDDAFLGFILGPLGVVPEYQRQGIGTQLIERGRQKVLDMGADILLVYGNPQYYGRFGFSADTAEQYAPPYELQHPYGWQAVTLNQQKARTVPKKIVVVSSLRNPVLW